MVDVFGLSDALEPIAQPWGLDGDRAPRWAKDAVAPLAWCGRQPSAWSRFSCPHVGCSHYGPALCHQYFLPPPLERHHDTCDFIATLALASGKTLAEVWAEWRLPPTDLTPVGD